MAMQQRPSCEARDREIDPRTLRNQDNSVRGLPMKATVIQALECCLYVTSEFVIESIPICKVKSYFEFRS